MNQGLHSLPEGLWEQPGALEHVQLIDVSKNCLSTLPPRLLFWVGGLKKLDASQNMITELPVGGPFVYPLPKVHAQPSAQPLVFCARRASSVGRPKRPPRIESHEARLHTIPPRPEQQLLPTPL